MFQVYLTIFAIIIVGYFFYEKKKRYENFWKYIYAIPGPDFHPLIGNTQTFSRDPVELFKIIQDRIRTYSPISKIWVLNLAAVTVTSPEDVELVLSGMKHISKGATYKILHQWLGTGLLTSTGSKWQQRRKILTPAFHFSILQDFVKVFNKETNNLVKSLRNICDQPHVNVLDPITEFTLNSIGETSLGVDMNLQPNRNDYKKAIYKFGHNFVYRHLRPWFKIPFLYEMTTASKETKEAVNILHDFSTNIIKERKKSFKDLRDSTQQMRKRMALLDLLLKARDNDGTDIDDVGIREEVDTFMFEGHDTTTLAISFMLLALANESKWQENIRHEIFEILGDTEEHPSFKELGELKLMERCIKESLRLYPSVPVITRVADEDIKTATGYTIPKGANIHVNIFWMHRSNDIWENPDKFDPDRFLPENSVDRHPFSFIAFSAGPRNCIGQRFAMLEMKAVLCGILRNFILEPIDKPEDIVFKADLVLRPHNELRVKFVPRK